jgi:hypothetical protein
MKTVIYAQADFALIQFFLADKLQAAKYRSCLRRQGRSFYQLVSLVYSYGGLDT